MIQQAQALRLRHSSAHQHPKLYLLNPMTHSGCHLNHPATPQSHLPSPNLVSCRLWIQHFTAFPPPRLSTSVAAVELQLPRPPAPLPRRNRQLQPLLGLQLLLLSGNYWRFGLALLELGCDWHQSSAHSTLLFTRAATYARKKGSSSTASFLLTKRFLLKKVPQSKPKAR